MKQLLPRWLLGAALLAPVVAGHAQSPNPLPPETVLVGVTGTPAATEENFTIATPAQDLIVTLTDLQVPAALSTATVVVTQGSSMVGNATLASPATSAALAITGALGPYTLRVFGAPNAQYSVGTFSVCVAPKADPAKCIQNASLAGNISTPGSAANPAVSTLSVNLAVTTAGNYTVTFQDDAFPAALQTAPNLALFQGSTPVPGGLGIQSGAIFNLSPGAYTLLAIAQANSTSQAGLYGINIAGPGGVALLSNTYPVGVLSPASQPNNPSAQTLTLRITDFAYPTALGTGSALVTSGATVLGSTTIGAANPAMFQALQGPLQVWSFASAGTGAGTYEVDLTSAGGSLLETAAAVSTASSLAYAYVTPTPLAAGSYQATASDFQFPSILPTLQFAVAQNGVILQQAATASTVKFTAAAGPVVLLVGVTPPASGNGLFDVNVQAAGAAQPLFDQTQPVSPSGLFATQSILIGTAGNFVVTLTDLQFPAQFQDLDLVVSIGGTVLGKIIGGGSFPITAAPALTPGTYQLSFIATPAAMQQYGMYGLQIVNALPVVTLKASPMTVTTGATTTLSWTSANATACTGSGSGFSGSQSITSGSLAVAVSSTTTFMLTCTGPGGSASQSVKVTATPAPSGGGGGGGGELGGPVLMLLGLGVLVRMRNRHVRRLS